MAMLHQEIDAVLLGRDGVGLLLGHALHDFDVLDVELVAAGRALVGADAAGDDDAGLLGEVPGGLPDFRRDGGLGHDALHGARAIAKDGEEQLAGGAHVVEPAVQHDGLAFMLFQAGDGGGDGVLVRCVVVTDVSVIVFQIPSFSNVAAARLATMSGVSPSS